MHDEVAVRNALVNFFDSVHRQDVAGRFAGELVSTVTGSDGDGQGVDARSRNELLGFFRVGQQLIV